MAQSEQTDGLHARELLQQSRRESLGLLSLAIPALCIIFFIIVIPVGWLFYLSFIGDEGQFTLEHYTKMKLNKGNIELCIMKDYNLLPNKYLK